MHRRIGINVIATWFAQGKESLRMHSEHCKSITHPPLHHLLVEVAQRLALLVGVLKVDLLAEREKGSSIRVLLLHGSTAVRAPPMYVCTCVAASRNRGSERALRKTSRWRAEVHHSPRYGRWILLYFQ